MPREFVWRPPIQKCGANLHFLSLKFEMFSQYLRRVLEKKKVFKKKIRNRVKNSIQSVKCGTKVDDVDRVSIIGQSC